MSELKPCPFCGSDKAPELSSIWDCEMCANFEEEDCPECYEELGSSECMHIVVCAVNRGGCGASTGWHLNADDAIQAWNRRAKDEQA